MNSSLVTVLQIIQIVISVALVIVIILQAKGVGLGSLFGSNEAGLGITKTRRGLEKTLHQITIVLGAAFLLNAVIQVLIQR
ncbi:MAG: preprotein translocase subunit SecG [Anaerolineae bacterium]|nr:preprotein translocase subunit SecG [Anaerolineae bacterium]